MYEYLNGKITQLTPSQVVLDIQGVGYSINISVYTYELIQNSTEIKLWIYFHIREDLQVLYGFADKMERDIFKILILAQGVSVTTARIILSTFSWQEIQTIILAGDEAKLTKIKGIGIKSAQRLILDLKDKIQKLPISKDGPIPSFDGRLVKDEAVMALEILGFQRKIIEKIIDTIIKDNPQAKVEDLIKMALAKV